MINIIKNIKAKGIRFSLSYNNIIIAFYIKRGIINIKYLYIFGGNYLLPFIIILLILII